MARTLIANLRSEEGSVTPVVVVVAGLLMCLISALAGVMQVVDAYARLASRAEQVALLTAQRTLLGGSGCAEGDLPRGTRFQTCRSDETGAEVTLTQEIEVWSRALEISAFGRYLIAP